MKKRYLLIFAAMLAVCTILLAACGSEDAKAPAIDDSPVVDGEDAADDTVGENIKENKAPENPDEYHPSTAYLRRTKRSFANSFRKISQPMMSPTALSQR